MLPKRMRIAGFFGGALLCFICSFLGFIYWDGYYLPNKPCRPVGYPDGVEIGRESGWVPHRIITTTDSLSTVLMFYDQRLNAKALQVESGQWHKEELGQAKYIYSCYAPDINDITAESGCITITEEETRTHIDAILLQGDGAVVPCLRQ